MVGVVVGFILNDYYSTPTVNTVVKTEVKYVTDTQYIKIPKIVKVVESVEVSLPNDCDSLRTVCHEIAQSYNSRVYYEDTLRLDTLGVVVLKQQVVRNSIDSLKYIYSVVRGTYTTIINTTHTDSQGLFVGAVVGPKTLAPNIQYLFKSNYTVSLGYDFYNKSFLVGASIKIK